MNRKTLFQLFTGAALLTYLVAVSAQHRGACQTRRACEGGSIDFRCPAERPTVHICDVFYGRRLPGSEVCPHPSIRTTSNCRASTAPGIVRGTCQGKRSCTVSAMNIIYGDPCEGTYKYLEISYRCAFHSRVCEGGNLRLSCSWGQRLHILDGFYGRTQGSAVCPHSSIRDLNCRASNSMTILRSRCDGRSSCTVPANNGVFGDPCVYTYKYLDVIYDCV